MWNHMVLKPFWLALGFAKKKIKILEKNLYIITLRKNCMTQQKTLNTFKIIYIH